jgi:Domain of unknown function (DUF4386)
LFARDTAIRQLPDRDYSQNRVYNMTSSTIDNSQRTAAKVAGWSFLFTMVIVVFANYGLLNPLMVRGDVAQTARNIVAHETQFRVTVVCFLAYSAGVFVLLVALYVILKPVNPGLALAGAIFRLVFASLWLLATLNLLSALRLLGSASYLQAFEVDRLQALARLHVAANFDAYYVGLPFFGLAATVCAYLFFKSNYIPKGLALFGVISSAWCVLCAFVYLVFPGFANPVNPYWFDSPMAIFELALSFWLLFKGLRSSKTAEQTI